MTLVLVAPSRGHITQRFAARQVDGNPHAGQDYAYTNGREIFPEVYAAADGLVLFAGDARGLAWPNIMYLNPDFDRTDNVDSSAGNYTIIAHFDAAGNRIALTGYGHQEEVWVKAGDRVHAGQRIGTVGETGFSAGKHLHFDLVLFPFDVDDAPYYGRVDPNPYIIAGGACIGPAGEIIPTKEDTLSAEEVRQINDHTTATLKAITLPGKAGEREAGGLFDLSTKVDRIDSALLPGIAGQRQAGPVYAALASIQGQNAGLAEAIRQLGAKPGQPIDLAAVTAAAEKGAEAALANLRIVSEGA